MERAEHEIPGPGAAVRVGLEWQLWLDGEIRRAPIPLADGVLVIIDRSVKSAVIRLDEDGREMWQLELPGVASGDPARTHGVLALPLDGERVVMVDLHEGRLLPASLSVPGAAVRGSIAALGGRVWVRLGKTADGLGPFLAVLDMATPDERPHLFPDPLGLAIESHCRRTNRTLVTAAEHPDGHVLLAGIDEESVRVLWQHQIPGVGLADLWAAGGLVDVVLTDAVRSWQARSGTPLTRRFDGMTLEGAVLAGETLIVPVNENGHGRRFMAFDAATEDKTGDIAGIQRLIGASSDLALMRDAKDGAVLVELPTLTPLILPDADAIEAAELVAFSRHELWVVAHGGRSLSALEPL